MAETYQVHVFGKKGCDKCAVLNERLDKLLADEAWSEFKKVYNDVETERGIITFCEAECINPQRIPAMLVMRRNGKAFQPVANRSPGKDDPVYKKSKLYQHLGLQTDYSDVGKGVLSPRMIKSCLAEARGE